jgi:branched-subunit amino acid aminotransferase/4-amino-4-deoxychorismate lyase
MARIPECHDGHLMELNGRPVSTGELAGLALYGYGHFTTMLVTDLRVRGLDLHMDRLSRDCRTLFGVELDIPRVRELARRSARAHLSPSVVRVTVFDPHMDLGHPSARQLPQILVSTRPAPTDASPPPVRLGTRRFTRDTPQIKSTGLFGAIRQRRAAQLDGYDDALFMGVDGRVSEGPTWNIGFLDGGGLVWPQAPCLPGVTTALVSRAAENLGIPVTTRPIASAASTRTAGAFITNAATGVRQVAAIDGVHLPQAALVRKFAAAYADLPGDPL